MRKTKLNCRRPRLGLSSPSVSSWTLCGLAATMTLRQQKMRCKDRLLEIFNPHLFRLRIRLARQILIVCEGFAGVG